MKFILKTIYLWLLKWVKKQCKHKKQYTVSELTLAGSVLLNKSRFRLKKGLLNVALSKTEWFGNWDGLGVGAKEGEERLEMKHLIGFEGGPGFN